MIAAGSVVTVDLTGHSLLAVFAHPDDESVACGGLLAWCARLGARTSLLCLTHGENRSGVRDMVLYDARAHELKEAAQVLGIGELILLDYPDGFLPWINQSELEGRITAEIRRGHPDVVITFGADGLYWHPDHIAVSQRTTAAVAALGEDAPELYYVTMPLGVMWRIVSEFPDSSGRGRPTLLGVVELDAFGLGANPPTLVADVRSCAVRKLTAIKCHRTQVADGALQNIPDHDAARLLGMEHFHRAPVGSGGETFIDQLGRTGGGGTAVSSA